LTVLQNREVTPLGANRPVPIDIRLICATNIGLNILADEEKFRKDLIYRINTVEIVVPPLRDREGDIRLLARYFVDVYAEKYAKPGFDLDDALLKKLEDYHFPGNVRELQYALERAVIMADKNTLKAEDLIFSPIEKKSTINRSKDLTLDVVEKETILQVLERNKGN